MSHLHPIGVTTKICTACRAEKPTSEFYASGKRRGGIRGRCKQCCKELGAETSRACHQRRYLRPGARAFHLHQGARKRAEKKGLEFSLSPEWILERIEQGACPVTGIEFDLHSRQFCPSLDRIDNSRGYTPDNVRVVVWMFNRARGDGSDADLRRLVGALHGRI